jgi:hypothetical protein
MSPKHHYPPISGGDRKALTKGLSKSRAMTRIFAELRSTVWPASPLTPGDAKLTKSQARSWLSIAN